MNPSPLRKDRLVELAARIDGAFEFNKVNLGRPSPDFSSPCGSMSLGKTTTYYPTLWLEPQDQELNLPDSGKAIIEYKVKRRTVTETDGKKRYEASIEVQSIEPMEGKAKKKPGLPGAAKPMKFAVRPGHVIAFTKVRNAMGEFAPNDGSAIDESMMARAYGAPSVVRRSLGGGKAGHAVASGGKATAALLTGRRATSLPVIRRAASRLIA
jgi:hypothetical protein